MKNQLAVKTLLKVILLLSVTSHANAFLVSDFSSNKIELNDHMGNGRWTLVMLWQLNCVPCEKQKPAVEAFHNKYQSSKAHVIGLAMDGHQYMSEIEAFYKEKPTSFPSLVVFGDVFHDQIVAETGKIFPASPGYLLYDPDGKIVLSINHVVDIDVMIEYIEKHLNS